MKMDAPKVTEHRVTVNNITDENAKVPSQLFKVVMVIFSLMSNDVCFQASSLVSQLAHKDATEDDIDAHTERCSTEKDKTVSTIIIQRRLFFSAYAVFFFGVIMYFTLSNGGLMVCVCCVGLWAILGFAGVVYPSTIRRKPTSTEESNSNIVVETTPDLTSRVEEKESTISDRVESLSSPPSQASISTSPPPSPQSSVKTQQLASMSTSPRSLKAILRME